MPISEDFIPLLTNLVENYQKTSVTSGIIVKSRPDPDFKVIFANIKLLPEIIKEHRLTFNNQSVYNHISKLFCVYEEHNTYFRTQWRIFNNSYLKMVEQHLSTLPSSSSSEYTIGSDQDHPSINVVPDGEPDALTIDLMNALKESHNSMNSVQKAHASEVALLNRKLSEAQRKALILAEQNEALKGQLQLEETLKRLQPEFDNAQKQLLKAAEIFQYLADGPRKALESIPPLDSQSPTASTSNAEEQIPKTAAIEIPPVSTPEAPASSRNQNTVPPPPPPPAVVSQQVDKPTPPPKNSGSTAPGKSRFFSVADELSSRFQSSNSSDEMSQKRLDALANFQKKSPQ